MHITEIIWKDYIIEKLAQKHGVNIEEVEEVFSTNPMVRKIARGKVKDEHVYAAFSQIDSGRDGVLHQ